MSFVLIRGLMILTLSAVAVIPALAAERPPGVGETMPGIVLQVPGDPALQKYLGVAGSGPLPLTRVDAEVLIVQIFSMYCPHCQREAPVVNRVYEIIEGDPRTRGRVKLVGIGAGNSTYEVGVFKQKYSIPFPLFEDENFVIHDQLGEVRTPYFIVVRTQKDGTREVVYSRLGGVGDPKKFVDRVVELAGVK